MFEDLNSLLLTDFIPWGIHILLAWHSSLVIVVARVTVIGFHGYDALSIQAVNTNKDAH